MRDARKQVGSACPFCGCQKVYTMNDGKSQKCSNPECRAKFSSTAQSLIENTKIPLTEWFSLIYLSIRSRGKYPCIKFKAYNPSNALMIDMKLQLIYENIPKGEFTIEDKFSNSIKSLYLLNNKKNDYRKTNPGRQFLINQEEILDLNNEEVYRRMVTVTYKHIYYALDRKWIFEMFCEPEDVIAEVLIAIHDSGFKEISGALFIKMMRKCITRMWGDFVKTRPNIQNWYASYYKQWKRRCRQNISTPYCNDLIYERYRAKGVYNWREGKSSQEIREEIKKQRESIIEHRKRSGYELFLEYQSF